jgi:hypothetical protein
MSSSTTRLLLLAALFALPSASQTAGAQSYPGGST